LSSENDKPKYRLAFVASDGMEEPELVEPLRVVKQTGAAVDVLASHKQGIHAIRRQPEGTTEQIELLVDKTIAEVRPDAYDAVMVPGHSIESGRLRLEGDAKEFVESMREAGKPVLCIPVPTVEPPPAEVKREPTLRAVKALLQETFARWSDINAPRLGAALAYYTVLSMAPLLVVVVAMAGLVFGKDAAQGQIVWQIQDLVGVDGARGIQSLLASTQEHAKSGAIATVIGLFAI
jgi:hypothetical protein